MAWRIYHSMTDKHHIIVTAQYHNIIEEDSQFVSPSHGAMVQCHQLLGKFIDFYWLLLRSHQPHNLDRKSLSKLRYSPEICYMTENYTSKVPYVFPYHSRILTRCIYYCKLMFAGIYVCVFETTPCSRGLIFAV